MTPFHHRHAAAALLLLLLPPAARLRAQSVQRPASVTGSCHGTELVMKEIKMMKALRVLNLYLPLRSGVARLSTPGAMARDRGFNQPGAARGTTGGGALRAGPRPGRHRAANGLSQLT